MVTFQLRLVGTFSLQPPCRAAASADATEFDVQTSRLVRFRCSTQAPTKNLAIRHIVLIVKHRRPAQMCFYFLFLKSHRQIILNNNIKMAAEPTK